ncbi:glycosyltransferase family 4 protein [Armatimonas rosea]|uniref:Glycosyltransferase involved in cell wall biosynthesis n=1 Tax=Armatimonas rosea TaxID=685828 RepID=A0A7W9SQQ8_ARMRO|nr:glycosyltransferase family 4 protein [Armatimonas rosea]MBB6050469.1 glycosyltransferase involved in cell wall biosynthesis [Armatimonas rosea]
MVDGSTKVKVLYLDHTAKWSGGEIALYRTLSALDRSVVEPNVLLPMPGEFASRLQSVGVTTEIDPIDEKILEIRKDSLGKRSLRDVGVASSYIRYSLRIAKRAKAKKMDLIHCNSLKSDFYGAVAGKIARVPVVWHVRDYIDSSYLPSKVATLFQKFAQKIPNGVITNSKSTELGLFPKGAGRQLSRVVYDGLMESELQSACPTLFTEWRDAKPKIGLLGRIVAWKGQHVFIDAARELKNRGIEAQYQIIGAPLFGEADYEAKIKKQAEPLGSQMEFLGFRSDVPALLRQLDILAHCSISPEPFGQVVVEGMAEGLPVVASDGGGVVEIIEQGVHGIRTPMGDAVALADALQDLLLHPEKASMLGRSAHARVREKFTAAHSARGVESFYQELLGRK